VFFQRAYDEYPDAPVWSGELYLEAHRATFTTQAKTKAGNRRSEHLLREAELWSTAAFLYAGAAYPYDELDRTWKTVLLHQFHDILPGSSIAWVHREARETYQRVRAELAELISRAAGQLPGPAGVLNAAPHDRAEVVMLPDGTPAWASAPALGGGRCSPGLPPGVTPVTVDGTVLDNGLLRVEIDADGLLASVPDLVADREILPPGPRGNLPQLHPDPPAQWDAWNIDRSYLHRRTDLSRAESVEVVSDGPLIAAVRVSRRVGSRQVGSGPVGDSTIIVQTYRLAAGPRRLDLEAEGARPG